MSQSSLISAVKQFKHHPEYVLLYVCSVDYGVSMLVAVNRRMGWYVIGPTQSILHSATVTSNHEDHSGFRSSALILRISQLITGYQLMGQEKVYLRKRWLLPITRCYRLNQRMVPSIWKLRVWDPSNPPSYPPPFGDRHDLYGESFDQRVSRSLSTTYYVVVIWKTCLCST